MNAPTFRGVARAASIALILVLAAATGLAVGNLLQEVSGDGSITAQASFSRDALDDLNALRADRPAAAAYPDYAIRHAPVSEAYPDWAIRHPAALTTGLTDTFRLTGPSDVEPSSDASQMTDTFRLTGPSDVGGALRGQRKAN